MSTPKKKPDKPYKDFPLFPASNGQWAKKILGKRYYFGVWSDPDSAIEFYERVRHDLYSGREPSIGSLRQRLTLENMADLFLEAKKRAADAGEISLSTYKEYRRSCEAMVLILGKRIEAESLAASDFVKLREELAKQTESHVTLKNHLTKLKVLFRWAFESGTIAAPLKYQQVLKLPAARLLRVARTAKNRLWTQAEIKSLLKASSGFMRPAILLGINCGFGNKDCCELNWSNIAGDWVDFPRNKTGVDRRAKLWPETVKALNRWKRECKSFASEYVCCSLDRKKLGGDNTPIAHLFEDIAELAGIDRNGRGFYSLRHTYRTIADGTQDQPAIMLTMGHADNSINGVYRQVIDDERLERIAEAVRKWLYG
jgi:integrase